MYRSFSHKKLRAFTLPLLIVAALFLTACLESRVGFQGQLTDDSGDPVPNGDYQMVVRFYSSDTGGTSIYTDT